MRDFDQRLFRILQRMTKDEMDSCLSILYDMLSMPGVVFSLC